MAFKDKFEKFVSYFDTDDVSEVEGGLLPPAEAAVQQPAPKTPPTQPNQATQGAQASQSPRPSQLSRQERGARLESIPGGQAAASRQRQPLSQMENQQATTATRQVASQQATSQYRGLPNRPQVQVTEQTVSTSQGQMKIALKYPRRYEDAPAIVDLLINNECVLIDFEHMLDAQARRCLDFLDGASRVLYGSLQKVGTTMYLLAPANVVVDIEELIGTGAASQSYRETSYNYDMQRR